MPIMSSIRKWIGGAVLIGTLGLAGCDQLPPLPGTAPPIVAMDLDSVARALGRDAYMKTQIEGATEQLQAKIKELQADARSTSREEAQNLEAKLDALADSVKDGWDDVTEAVAKKLNDWLKDD